MTEVSFLRKYFLILIALFLTALVLSGCFNMQSTLSYEYYNEFTPASLVHVYVMVKSITANNNVVVTNLNSPIDLVTETPRSLANDIGLNNDQTTVNSLSFSLGPVATLVYQNNATATVKIATPDNIAFYSYSTQQVEEHPMQIMGKGLHKTAFILWNLSNLATTATTNVWKPHAKAFDKDSLVKVDIRYHTTAMGTYTAEISDGLNSFTFNRLGCYNPLNERYDFKIYPFKSPTPNGYVAYVSIKTSTQTVASTTVNIYDKDVIVELK